MKYFLAIALIAAVASAGVVKPTAAVAEIQQIVQAINDPSTDPATAIALQDLLLQQLGLSVAPGPVNIVDHPADIIAVGPAIVAPVVPGPVNIVDHPADVISVGPAIVAPVVPGPVNIVDQAENIDVSPVAIGPAFVDFEDTVQPTPVVAASAESTAPLVQIILNINQATAAAPTPGPAGAAAVVDQETIVPGPVNVVEQAVVPGPVNIVEQPILVSPVQVVEPIVPGPVNIVDGPVIAPVPVGIPTLPVVVQPVQVGTPILPAPAVVLPEELN